MRPVGWTSACAHNIPARGNWRISRRKHKSVFCPYRRPWTSSHRKKVWKNLEKSGDGCAGAPFGHRSLRSPPSLVRWGFSCSSCGPARIDCRTPYNKAPRLRSRINLQSSTWRQAPLQQLMRLAFENRPRLRSLDELLFAGASSMQRSY